MNFIERVKAVLGEEYNESYTENGALGYKTSGSNMLDFNFKIASYRSMGENEIIRDFMKVFLDNKILAMQFLFFIRDREEGLGERRLFRIIIKHLADNESEYIKPLIQFMPEYGRFDDLFEMFNTKLEDDVLSIIINQLTEDSINYDINKPISLLAKWLPSVNTSSKETRKQAFKIIEYINSNFYKMDKKIYRQKLSKLRKYIDITERKMSANEWNKIKYENVPSRANLIYNNAFLKHDEDRRRVFLGQVEKGEKEIHAGKLYPHDIVNKYNFSQYGRNVGPIDKTLELLWKALPEVSIENTLVVADGSGSMYSTIGRTSIRAISVANALAIYFAEHNKGQFKDEYITFSENPQFVNLKGLTTLRDKLQKAIQYCEVANTNIERVFMLILDTAIKYNTSQEEMPKNILIISDMEFDGAVDGIPNQKLFKTISDKYVQAGYSLPRLIFWDVNCSTGTIPLKENNLGVALVSGFSTNIAEMVMSNKLDPLEALLDKVNSPRYSVIGKILEKYLKNPCN